MRRSKSIYPNVSTYLPNSEVITQLSVFIFMENSIYILSSLIFLDFPSGINPLRQVPAIVDGRFNLFERYFSFRISRLMRFFKFHCVIGLVWCWLQWSTHSMLMEYGIIFILVNGCVVFFFAVMQFSYIFHRRFQELQTIG